MTEIEVREGEVKIRRNIGTKKERRYVHASIHSVRRCSRWMYEMLEDGLELEFSKKGNAFRGTYRH